MSLRDEALARALQGRATVCRVTLTAHDLRTVGDDALADEWLACVNDPTLPASSLARAMRDRGHQVSEESVTRHRRGDCKCR